MKDIEKEEKNNIFNPSFYVITEIIILESQIRVITHYL